MSTRNGAAPRARRPRNRRAMILAAATDLLYERGYDQVSMGDLAEVVGVTPSALYRHFTSKQHLLGEVIGAALGATLEPLVFVDPDDIDAACVELGIVAVRNRKLGLLWQREGRRMAPSDLARGRAEMGGMGRMLSRPVGILRPELSPGATDLLAWAGLGVLNSISYHRTMLPDGELEAELAAMLRKVLDTRLPDGLMAAPAEDPGPGIEHGNRREALQAKAVHLFARDGYSGVSIEQLGAAVGIAGASVYNHVSSKQAMLSTAFDRGMAVLFSDLARVLDCAHDAEDALSELTSLYVRFALAQPDLLDLLATETQHLAPDQVQSALQSQRDYVNEWIHILQLREPGLDRAHARVRVQACLGLTNSIARIPRLRRYDGLEAGLRAICLNLLDVPG